VEEFFSKKNHGLPFYKRRSKQDTGALKKGQRAFKRGQNIQKTDIVKRQAFGPDFFL